MDLEKADWSPRYPRPRPSNYEALDALIQHDQDLLKIFGASLGGVDPGAQIFIGDATISLNNAGWNWHLPLLTQLRAYRQGEYTMENVNACEGAEDG